MTADHTSYEELASQRRDSADYREGYAEAQRAYLIGRPSASAGWPSACPRSNSPPEPE